MNIPSSNQIIIADYTDSVHATAIVDMMKLYSLDPMGGGEELSHFAQQNMVKALQEIPGAFSVLAFDGNNPVGLINCLPGFSTFKCKPLINIHDVIVKSDFRGQKITSKMLLLVEEVAVRRGCCKLTLEVLEGNASAKTAYTQFGFSGYELDPKMGSAMFWDKKI